MAVLDRFLPQTIANVLSMFFVFAGIETVLSCEPVIDAWALGLWARTWVPFWVKLQWYHCGLLALTYLYAGMWATVLDTEIRRVTCYLGEQMTTHSFVGKTVNRDQLAAYEADVHAPGDFDCELTVAEVFLWDFECNGTDRTGRNAYSIQLSLDEQDRIVRIQRVGHCHMCGGQGSDDNLDRFPHQTLEDEACKALMNLVV